MCCCGTPNINGQFGYSWDGKNQSTHPINPPELLDGESLIFDEPGRCGGLDSHSHHYRVIARSMGLLVLAVRHGAGDDRVRLSCARTLLRPLAALDSTSRYWMLNAIYHAHADARRDARDEESARWRSAAVDKRIKIRRSKGLIRVSIKERASA